MSDNEQQEPVEGQEEQEPEEPRTMITQAQINESLSVIARTAGTSIILM